MPITKSAKKALRSSLRKRVFNLQKKEAITNSRRSLLKLLALPEKDLQAVSQGLSLYFSSLDKAAKTKFITKGKADRLKSRMTARVKKALNENENLLPNVTKTGTAKVTQEKKSSTSKSTKKPATESEEVKEPKKTTKKKTSEK